MMDDFFRIAAVLSVAAVFGGMTFFSTVLAPLIFRVLSGPTAAQFLRRAFPVYYGVMGILSALAAGVALGAGPPARLTEAMAMAVVAVVFVIARQVLMPRINAARDEELAGSAAAGQRFRTLHGLSVAVNVCQLAVVAVTLVALASHGPAAG